MSQQPEQNKTEHQNKMRPAEEILEMHVKYRQLISFGNYSCVGIPYEDALKAVKHASQQTASLQKQVEELREENERLKELLKESISAINYVQELERKYNLLRYGN